MHPIEECLTPYHPMHPIVVLGEERMKTYSLLRSRMIGTVEASLSEGFRCPTPSWPATLEVVSTSQAWKVGGTCGATRPCLEDPERMTHQSRHPRSRH